MPVLHFTDLTGLTGIASATAAVALQLPGMKKLEKPRLTLLLAMVFAMMIIPFNGMPLSAYLRGMTGDLSITSLFFIWCALLRPWCNCAAFDGKHRFALLAMVALAALLLYPMALGAGLYDPYRLGYGDPPFILVLLLVALAGWLRRNLPIALCIALASFAWAIGWYESNNLWDYLIDPFVSTYALAAFTISGLKLLFKLKV
jgi:hypothetical protein